MPIVAIAEFDGNGLASDRPAHTLPPNMFSDGQHVCFGNGEVKARRGESIIFGTPSVEPYMLFPVVTTSNYFWVYMGLAAAYAIDIALVHTNITRPSGGAYNATADARWTGGNFNGILIASNPNDVPQMWTPNAVNDFGSLTGWNTNWRCGAMRPFKNYLVAVDVSKFGTRYPHMVKWSHYADPGAVPVSWDEADATKDAGEVTLADSSGFCVDLLSMRDVNVVYKEDSTWLMQHIGGTDIFGFRKLFAQVGMLATHCGVQLPDGRHAILGADDVVFHNGQSAQSIISQRLRRRLFANIDTTNYRRSFAVCSYEENEVWFCVPEHGELFPTIAYCWNWETNAWSLRDFPTPPAVIVNGRVGDPSGGYIWANDVQTWDTDTSEWDSRLYNPAALRMVGAMPSPQSLRAMNDSYTNAGSAITSFVERKSLGIPFKQGVPPDMHSMKFLRGVRPLFTGAPGDTVNIQIGVQQDVMDEPEWLDSVTYTIGDTEFVDTRVTGRLFAYRITGTGARWGLSGIELDVDYAGGF